MMTTKKEVAILVSDKQSPFVNFLEFYFAEKGLITRSFESRNSLYLFLLTHNPMSILVSQQFKQNNPQTIITWVKKKYRKSAILFNEKDLSDKPDDHYLDILKQAKPLPTDTNCKSELDVLTSYLEKVITEAKTNAQELSQEHTPALNKIFDLVSGYLNISADTPDKKIESMQALPLKKENHSGYLLLNTENKKVSEAIAKKLNNEVKTSDPFTYRPPEKTSIQPDYLGSVNINNEKVDTFGFKCKLPEFKIMESDDMLETDAVYFTSETPVDFDVYLYLEYSAKDYHYLSPGCALSEYQIENLSHNNKKVRIKKKDKDKLMSYLNLSYMSHVSASR